MRFWRIFVGLLALGMGCVIERSSSDFGMVQLVLASAYVASAITRGGKGE